MKKINKVSALFLAILLTASVSAEMNKDKDHHNVESKDHSKKNRAISSTKEDVEVKENIKNIHQNRLQIDRFGKLPMHY